MNSILEATIQLIPIIQASVKCYSMNTELYPLQEAGHDLQLATYWLLAAEKELNTPNGNEIIEEDQVRQKIKRSMSTPSLLGTPQHLEYMETQLVKLQSELQTYTNINYLPPTVLHKVNQGWNKIMEAYFNTQLATTYYGELSKRGRGNK